MAFDYEEELVFAGVHFDAPTASLAGPNAGINFPANVDVVIPSCAQRIAFNQPIRAGTVGIGKNVAPVERNGGRGRRFHSCSMGSCSDGYGRARLAMRITP